MKKSVQAYKNLFDVVEKGDVDAVRFFFAKGVDINAKNSNGETPLWYAAISGSVEVIKYLISQGADVNAPLRYIKKYIKGYGERAKNYYKIYRFLYRQKKGLCLYCGGRRGIFSKKCKSCGKVTWIFKLTNYLMAAPSVLVFLKLTLSPMLEGSVKEIETELERAYNSFLNTVQEYYQLCTVCRVFTTIPMLCRQTIPITLHPLLLQ